MGIKNLLKFAKPACRRGHVREFYGDVLALDMSCLIYRGLYNDDYLGYVKAYVERLTKLRCDLYLVFDGKAPLAKKAELEARALTRVKRTIANDGNEWRDLEFLATGIRVADSRWAEGNKISPYMIDTIEETFASYPNVQIIHAPGESDPQLAYLARNKLVRAVVTDDSDLIVYGC